jgi:hypothetical protein
MFWTAEGWVRARSVRRFTRTGGRLSGHVNLFAKLTLFEIQGRFPASAKRENSFQLSMNYFLLSRVLLSCNWPLVVSLTSKAARWAVR